jgi:hypothetical protein
MPVIFGETYSSGYCSGFTPDSLLSVLKTKTHQKLQRIYNFIANGDFIFSMQGVKLTLMPQQYNPYFAVYETQVIDCSTS